MRIESVCIRKPLNAGERDGRMLTSDGRIVELLPGGFEVQRNLRVPVVSNTDFNHAVDIVRAYREVRLGNVEGAMEHLGVYDRPLAE